MSFVYIEEGVLPSPLLPSLSFAKMEKKNLTTLSLKCVSTSSYQVPDSTDCENSFSLYGTLLVSSLGSQFRSPARTLLYFSPASHPPYPLPSRLGWLTHFRSPPSGTLPRPAPASSAGN